MRLRGAQAFVITSATGHFFRNRSPQIPKLAWIAGFPFTWSWQGNCEHPSRGGNMKKLTFALLFAGGILMAQEQATPDQATQDQTTQHVSENQRRALRSQSPVVKAHSKKHINKDPEYRVTENKTTIVAMVPYGK